MAVILGFIILCMLQAAVAQRPPTRVPKPIPGRRDKPGPTPPPIQPLLSPELSQDCSGEFLLFIDVFILFY